MRGKRGPRRYALRVTPDVEEDLADASVPFSSGNAFMDELKIEHRTKLQEAGREGIDTDGMAELFEQQQAADTPVRTHTQCTQIE